MHNNEKIPAKIIDGKAIAEELQLELTRKVTKSSETLARPPGLAVILVGENPASKVYVRAKTKSAEKCGFTVRDIKLGENCTNEELIEKISQLNTDPAVDGILLQLPLPKGLDEFRAIVAIAPKKDVDGLHPFNQGLLLRHEKAPRPCTPAGVIKLIEKAQEALGLSKDLAGLKATILGRSILVGKPLGIMLLEKNCTVTYCHSKTRDLRAECMNAEIVIAAVGNPKLVKGSWIKKGAIVIDVGINRDSEGKLVGDVDFDEVSKICSAITPVPGGVGPMTVAMLLQNTFDTYVDRS